MLVLFIAYSLGAIPIYHTNSHKKRQKIFLATRIGPQNFGISGIAISKGLLSCKKVYLCLRSKVDLI